MNLNAYYIFVVLVILLDKKTIIAGGHDGDFLDDILEFDHELKVWKKIGSMPTNKRDHGLSLINYNAVKAYCN